MLQPAVFVRTSERFPQTKRADGNRLPVSFFVGRSFSDVLRKDCSTSAIIPLPPPAARGLGKEDIFYNKKRANLAAARFLLFVFFVKGGDFDSQTKQKAVFCSHSYHTISCPSVLESGTSSGKISGKVPGLSGTLSGTLSG